MFLRSEAKSGGGFADKSAELVHPANGPTSLLLTKEIGAPLCPPLRPQAEGYAPNLFEFRHDVVETAIDGHERRAQVRFTMLA